MPNLMEKAGWRTRGARPHEIIRTAGYAVILASAAAALLPAANFNNGPQIVGGLMLVAGLFEVLANLLRLTGRWAGTAAGIVSLAAGILIFAQPVTSFLTTVYIFTGWLLVRGLLLAASSMENAGPIRRATAIASATDLVLAAVVATGLTASTLVIALFGPTEPMFADLAWILAASFVAAGLLLVKIAREQPRSPR